MANYKTKQELIAQLKKLAEDKTEIPLKFGAMCYSPAPATPKIVTCEWCGKKIEEHSWLKLEPNRAHKIVKTISKLGYDVKLEQVCLDCTINHQIISYNDPYSPHQFHWVFSFKTKDEKEYHTAISNTESDYEAVIAFLTNKPVYSDYYDADHLLREELDLIKHMTGIYINSNEQ